MSYMLVNALEKISALNEHEILSKAFPLKAVQLNNFYGESGLKRFSIRFSALFSFLYCFFYCCRFFLYLFLEILVLCRKMYHMKKYDVISLIRDCDKLQDLLIRTNWETKENELENKLKMFSAITAKR